MKSVRGGANSKKRVLDLALVTNCIFSFWHVLTSPCVAIELEIALNRDHEKTLKGAHPSIWELVDTYRASNEQLYQEACQVVFQLPSQSQEELPVLVGAGTE